MSPFIFLIWIVIIPCLALSNLANSIPLGYFIDCGGTKEVTVDNILYIPDGSYTNVGNNTTINEPNILPTLTTLRYFPDISAKKYCYTLPVIKGSKYIVKTVYYYGGFDGGKQPPVFDQIIQGTRWSIVNTTEDYAKGLSSYYEVVVKSSRKTLSVCLARNADTGSSSPFISALEVKDLDDFLYNPIDFTKYALVTVARHAFGGEDIISYPDDKFNRIWQPFKDQNPVVGSHSSVTSSDFWNLPPAVAFTKGITTSRGKTLEIQWPPLSLPSTYYYVSLYFQDNRSPSPYSWRVFDISINGHTFFTGLNATDKGVTVYSIKWPLSGQTKLTMTPAGGEHVGPVINAGEVFQILPLSGRTQTIDVIAMEDLARSIQNPPADWNGDPCLPKGNSWIGVSCYQHNLVARVTTVNLTNVGLAGSLSPSIGNLSSLVHLWLGGNKISGTIPDMSGLKELQTLHLENNKLEGPVHPSLKKLPKLREINLQNNSLQGKITLMRSEVKV
ncbi:PREDICTED: probable LRR receptor-like serine/threonine-protein kinase At1g67720 [Lupinus angustifolius]|uniref:probable LRR receptor-like serine/threonine-protein kinase At1g67720 n=1 Tax=Lupinus angustifolius TaxID=3871 RepID=UPI00092EDD4D|nr:PREDICTED: probable LRR receptor-like serine/threonine-protein kinase At1g67720 [Lupinus angustifolius]